MTAAEAGSDDMLHSPIARQPQNYPPGHRERTSTRLYCSVLGAELISETVLKSERCYSCLCPCPPLAAQHINTVSTNG